MLTTTIEESHERIHRALEEGGREALRAAAEACRAADIAEVMDLLEDEQRSTLLYALPPRMSAEIVVLLDEAVRGEVVEDLDDAKLSEIVGEMPADDAADVMAELPIAQFDEVLEHIPKEQSDRITELLTYDEATAGGIMNPTLLSQPESTTVGQAVEQVRAFAADEEVHYIYVVDGENRLTGMVPLRRLVVNPPETLLSSVCERDPVTVNVGDDQEDVLLVIRKYDLAAVPVLDADGRLLGRITYDDVMDVAEEEAAEDIYRMAGTDAAELETHSTLRAARVRMFWLTPCMFGTLMVAGVLAFFYESSLSKTQMYTLVMFIPMIAATGGNTGIQASTIILRGFATGELAATKLGLVFAREARIAAVVAVACGVATAILGTVTVQVLRAVGSEVGSAADVDALRVGLAVGLGMFCAVCEAAALGIGLPFIFRRVGVDPAIASGPLITSFNDVLSALFYLTIALLILA